ncbi:MAG: oligosaccharide flippase family protein [Clostridia bacterium]|nr:oligosaccharide flippase family protein [Clostridia bacterium]
MKRKKVLASVATVTVFGVFTRVISFVFKIYLSRALGAEAIGLYQIAVSVFYLFASLSSGGVPLVLSRKAAESEALYGRADHSYFSSALVLGVLISATTTGALALLNTNLSFLFADEGALPLFLVTLPALMSTTIYSVVRGWMWGKRDFTSFSATETVEEVLRILFSALFISGVVGGVSGVYGVALAFAVSDVIVAVLLLVLFFVKGGKLTRPSKIKEILFPSLPVTAMRVFSGLISTLIAFLLPLRLMQFGMTGAEATASYGRVAGMANPLLLAPNALISSLAIVLIPEMSASGAKKRYDVLNRQLNAGLNFAFVIGGLFLTAYIALGREITELLYDDAISGEYLQYAAYVMLPMSLSQLTQSALNSIGKEGVAFRNYFIGNVALILSVVFLPKYIGIYSVAAATLVSLLCTAVLNVYSLRKYVEFEFHFVKRLVAVFLFVFPSAFLSDGVQSLLADGLGLYAIFPSALVGVASYIALCLCTDLVDVKGFFHLRRQAKSRV